MRAVNIRPDDERAFVREVAGEIEAVRLRRREQWRERPHPEGKRFTQEELVSEVYGAYKHLVAGRTLRIPSRSDMLRIADWLECTIHETNDLLLAAQYLPEVVELREDEERAVLERAKVLIHTLPLPAYVLTKGWFIADANKTLLVGNCLPPSYQLLDREETPFHWLGDPSHPGHANLAFDERLWQHTVRNVLHQFRHSHQRCQREHWYQAYLERIRVLPRFALHWDQLYSGAAEVENSGATYQWSSQLGIAYYDAGSVLHIGSSSFPHILLFHPVDAAAYSVYMKLGCPVGENRWEHALKLRGTG